MRYSILFSIFSLLVLSCNKDKYTTKPQLKYKSVNTKELRRGQELRITLSFTDAEGDIVDTLIVRKIVKPCAAGNGSFSDSSRTLPQFPTGTNQTGEIVVTYPYISLNPICAPRNDTAIFKFVLTDKAGNRSDTAVSEPIVIFN